MPIQAEQRMSPTFEEEEKGSEERRIESGNKNVEEVLESLQDAEDDMFDRQDYEMRSDEDKEDEEETPA